MELKQPKESNSGTGNEVLIVPYGIETVDKDALAALEAVLIVPYGIETFLL